MLGVSPLLIKVIRKFDNKEKIKLEDILLLNEKNGNYFTVLLVAILSMIPTPFPIPFISIFFGIILIILSFQMLLGKTTKFYIPQKILNISCKKNLIKNVITKILPRINRFEIYVKRNKTKFCIDSKSLLFIIHFCLLILSTIIIFPIPLIGMIPSIAVIVMCFGLINKTKIFINIGIVLTIISMLSVVLFYFFGKLAIMYILKLL